MVGATLTTVANLLKYVYLPQLQVAINWKTPLFAQLTRRTDIPVVGKNFVFSVQTAANEAVGAGAETADLPDPDSNSYEQATLPARINRGVMQISVPTMVYTRNGGASLADELDREMTDLKNSISRDMNRQLFGTGTGILSQVNGAVTSGVSVTCNNGITAADGTSRRIRANMVLDFYLAAALQATGIKVSGVSSATVFTVDQNITVSDGACIYRKGAKDIEVMGLDAIVDSAGALQGLNPATAGQECWSSYELAVNGALTEQAMIKACQTIDSNSGEYPTALVSNKGVQRAYWDLFDATVIRQPLTIQGGWKVLTFFCDGREIPWILDDDSPGGTLYFPNLDALPWCQVSDFTWMEEDGAILHRVTGKLAYSAVLFNMANLGTLMRSRHGKLTGLTEG